MVTNHFSNLSCDWLNGVAILDQSNLNQAVSTVSDEVHPRRSYSSVFAEKERERRLRERQKERQVRGFGLLCMHYLTKNRPSFQTQLKLNVE